MINTVTLVGRLTKDPELRKSQTNKSVVRFTLAVERRFKKDGGISADFITCNVWNAGADYLARYARKGMVIGLVGAIQTGSYEGKNGTVYTTEVLCDYVQILESRRAERVEIEEATEAPIPEPKKANAVKFGEEFISQEELPFY